MGSPAGNGFCGAAAGLQWERRDASEAPDSKRRDCGAGFSLRLFLGRERRPVCGRGPGRRRSPVPAWRQALLGVGRSPGLPGGAEVVPLGSGARTRRRPAQPRGGYAQGEGVPQDYREAAKWYRAAAEQGDTNAQYFLGEMYANGRGVSRDRREAMKWLDMAGNAPVGAQRSRLDDADESDLRNSVQPGR